MGDNASKIQTQQWIDQFKYQAQSNPISSPGTLCVGTEKTERGDALTVSKPSTEAGCVYQGREVKRLGFVNMQFALDTAKRLGIISQSDLPSSLLQRRTEPDSNFITGDRIQFQIPASVASARPMAPTAESMRTRDLAHGELLNAAQAAAMNRPSRMPGDICVGKVTLAGKGERLTFSNREHGAHCKAQDFYVKRIGYMPARAAAELQSRLLQADFAADPSDMNRSKLNAAEQRLNRLEWNDGEAAARKFESFDVFFPRFH